MHLADSSAMHELLPRIAHLRTPVALEKRLRLQPVLPLRVVHPVRQLVHHRHGEEPLLPQYQADQFQVGGRVGGGRGQVRVRCDGRLEEGWVQSDHGAEAAEAVGRCPGRVDGGAVPGCGLAPGLGSVGVGAGGELEGEHAGHLLEEGVEDVVLGFGEGRGGARDLVPVWRVGDQLPLAVEDRLPEDLHVEGLGEVGGAEG